MSSRRIATATVASALALTYAGGALAQQDHATPQEVVQRVRQAAQDIAKHGEASLATYGSRNDTSVWKDSYVTVVSCEGGTAVGAAHPIRSEFKGVPVARTLTFGPRPGQQIAADFCAAGRKPHGGWVEYNFPKPGEAQPERKVSYFLAAQGTPYVVGAGIYDPTATLEDLDKISSGSFSTAVLVRRGAGSSG